MTRWVDDGLSLLSTLIEVQSNLLLIHYLGEVGVMVADADIALPRMLKCGKESAMMSFEAQETVLYQEDKRFTQFKPGIKLRFLRK